MTSILQVLNATISIPPVHHVHVHLQHRFEALQNPYYGMFICLFSK